LSEHFRTDFSCTKKEERIMTSQPKVESGSVPDVGQVFELTLNPVVSPLDMVSGDGYTASKWKYTGTAITESQTRRFKLEQVGYCSNLDEVRRKLTKPGQKPAEGQFREAFKALYPKPDGQGPIGIPDASWVGPSGGADFPVLRGSGKAWRSFFDWADFRREGFWRWLVEVE
jgi:hypothetical protein